MMRKEIIRFVVWFSVAFSASILIHLLGGSEYSQGAFSMIFAIAIDRFLEDNIK